MQTSIEHIELDFTNHFGNPFHTINEADKQEIIADVKNVLWDAASKTDLIGQVETLYGFEVKNIITDYKIKEAN